MHFSERAEHGCGQGSLERAEQRWRGRLPTHVSGSSLGGVSTGKRPQEGGTGRWPENASLGDFSGWSLIAYRAQRGGKGDCGPAARVWIFILKAEWQRSESCLGYRGAA